MKITKTLSYLAIASFLTFAPMKTYAQDNSISVKIEFPEKQAELTDYVVQLAIDINDDGIPDKKGYETLLDKLGIGCNKNQNIEDYQKIMNDYVASLKTKSQFENFYEKAILMFTEKDNNMYVDKMLEITSEILKEIMEKLPGITDELNERMQEKSN